MQIWWGKKKVNKGGLQLEMWMKLDVTVTAFNGPGLMALGPSAGAAAWISVGIKGLEQESLRWQRDSLRFSDGRNRSARTGEALG